ncbi:hypothetical protein DL546_005600 [Coniochaeta pulveracea]|uniref:Uncharacterized protein n=1 Tax=Coniochaeta pulveracea TaxID=177199 RepID=A0A420Y413_9PEZI|nr:hypothetical protein DL546_005600 [Coniochaeta pulveracea]
MTMSCPHDAQVGCYQDLLDKFADIDHLNSDLRLISHEYRAACMHFQDAVVAADRAFQTSMDQNSTKFEHSALDQMDLADFMSKISAQLHELAAECQNGKKIGSLRGLQKLLDDSTAAQLAATLDHTRESSGLADALSWAQTCAVHEKIDVECEARIEFYHDIRENINTLDKFATFLKGLDFNSSRRPEKVLAKAQEKMTGMFQYFMEVMATATTQDSQDEDDQDADAPCDEELEAQDDN